MTKKKIKADDPEQAKRFAEIARALEAAGELNLTEAEKTFENAFTRIVPGKDRPSEG